MRKRRPPVPRLIRRTMPALSRPISALEPDDLLGTYAEREEEAGGRTMILTGDRDMYQCATGAVSVLYVRTGGKGAELVTPAGVRERYGIDPGQVPDFIALRGDPSDGL